MAVSNSSIEWTDSSWSPITGCTKVSPGCDHCYAETIATRFKGSKAFPNGFDVTLHPERLSQPLRWKKPRRIFVNSMSDLFHQDIPNEFIARVFAVMAVTPRHTFQILTKRHGRMRALLGSPAFRAQVYEQAADIDPDNRFDPYRHAPCYDRLDYPLDDSDWWPLPNVWVGVSVEDQKRADLRIPALLDTPAAVRFVSCEPLLGSVDLAGPIVPGLGRPRLTYWLTGRPGWGPKQITETGIVYQEPTTGPRIDWVIVGGESGHGARPIHPNWARSLRDQCVAAGVPFFFKQWGEWGPAPFVVRVCDPKVGWQGTEADLEAAKRDSEARGATHVHTGNPYPTDDGQTAYYVHEMDHAPWSLERVGLPEGLEAIRRWGKKRAGRTLDGRTWDEFPGGAQ